MQHMTLLLLSLVFTPVLGFAAEDLSSSLVWESGGVPLDGPKQAAVYPEGLYPYHKKCLEWTDEAYSNEDLEVERSISYGTEDRHKLDLWIPTRNKQKKHLPIVIMVHGGGWEVGFREYNGFIAQNLCFHFQTRQPQAIMITPSYKLGYSRDQMWPDSKDDILQVLNWLKEDGDNIIKKYGGDASRIILSGHSAGGHLTACAFCNKNIDPSIKAVFPISGPLGLRPKDWITESSGVKSWFHNRWIELFGFRKNRRKQVDALLRPIIGKDATSKQKNMWIQQASPLAQLEKLSRKERSRLPFFHFSYASKGDFPMLSMQAKKLKRLLRDRAKILVLSVNSHLDSHFCLKDKDCQWYEDLSQFIDSMDYKKE